MKTMIDLLPFECHICKKPIDNPSDPAGGIIYMGYACSICGKITCLDCIRVKEKKRMCKKCYGGDYYHD